MPSHFEKTAESPKKRGAILGSWPCATTDSCVAAEKSIAARAAEKPAAAHLGTGVDVGSCSSLVNWKSWSASLFSVLDLNEALCL